jgi:DNA-directed RNA polymerase specialized sigma24 family protein
MGGKKTENAAVSPKQEAFIDRLLEGMSVPEAAALLRTHRTTCWRWLQGTEVQIGVRVV